MRHAWITAAVLVLAGCGGDDTAASGGAVEASERIEAAVDSVTETTEITEDNDPNDLIGRPNGYEAAVVIYDDRTECDEIGAECGATIEEFGSESDAEERSDYIQGILDAGGAMFGTEYHYLDGGLLLRVSGELKPSEAEEYETAFAG